MTDSETQHEDKQPAPAPAAAARRPRKASSRAKSARPPKPKSAARRGKAPRRPRRAARSASFAGLLQGLVSKAAEAGAGIATLSGEGATAARRALKEAGTASKKTVGRLTKEWQAMDTQRKAQVVAAVLGALAAASAPFVRSRLRKK